MSKFLKTIDGRQVFDTDTPIKHWKDQDIQEIFRCSAEELREIKQTFKQQMHDTMVNGTPFSQQNLDNIPNASSLVETMWKNIEESSSQFDEMLSGARWDPKPEGLGTMLLKAMNKVYTKCRENLNSTKQNQKAKDKREIDAAADRLLAAIEGVDTEDEDEDVA